MKLHETFIVMVNLTNLLLIAKEHIRFTYDLMQGVNGRKKKKYCLEEAHLTRSKNTTRMNPFNPNRIHENVVE